jgi:ADP-ribose pyrophosphatase YjhB (NUDIX family)
VQKALGYLRGAIAGCFERRLGTLLGHFPPMGPEPAKRDGTSFYRTPRFCPACGAELAVSLPHPVCPGCGLVFYRNPLPAVVLLLMEKGRVLTAKRAFPPAKGEYCLPGGFIDLGESPEMAARRELKEETLLYGGKFTLTGSDRDITAYGSIVLYIYRVENWEGEPSPSDDVSELEWMKLQDVPRLAFPAHNRIIENLRRKE